MRRLLPCLFAAAALAAGCAPTQRDILVQQTALYTKCDHVQVDCVDDACSNISGGPWTALACGTRYNCTNTGGHIVCAPLPQ